MKFIHTADWHIGKFLKGISLIDEQEHIFKEFIKIVDDEKPDAIIIAGDIYDRNIPPADAVNLFDEIVCEIVSREIPLFCISGNHDSADRLNFASRLLAKNNLFIAARLNKNPTTITLQDNFGDVDFSLMPYFDAANFRDCFNYEERIENNDAVKNYVEAARKKINGKRSVAVAHLFATGGKTSESERKFVGAVENVDAANFSAYNYTALGHLHKPQTMAQSHGYVVRYSGSPLKYSFDEANHKKGVTVVEIDGDGNTTFRHVDLIPRRDLIVVNGDIDALMNRPRTEDFVHAKLSKWSLYAMEKLRNSAFPNILSLEFDSVFENSAGELKPREGVSVLENFADFYKYSTNQDLNDEYRNAMENLLREIQS